MPAALLISSTSVFCLRLRSRTSERHINLFFISYFQHISSPLSVNIITESFRVEGTSGSLSSSLLLKAEPTLNTLPGDLLPRLSVPGLFQESSICHNDLLSAVGHHLKDHHCFSCPKRVQCPMSEGTHPSTKTGQWSSVR